MKKIMCSILAVLLMVSILVGCCAIKIHKVSIENVTVTDKGIKRYKDTDKYLIFTDKGVFEVTDSLIIMRFNSSDFYGSIEIGKTYNFNVRGYRVPILSMYQNIENFELIE